MAPELRERLARQASGETQLNFDPAGHSEPRFADFPVNLIDPDPAQPRKDVGDLSDLALSIREHGLVQPIIIEPREGGRFRIVTGERRFKACRSLGLKTIPAIVRTPVEQSRLQLQLVENLHRKDLHPLEEAQAYKRLMVEFGLTQRDVARRVGKSLSAINQTLRILDLDSTLLADVQTSEHANKSLLLEIAKETDPQAQQALWQQSQAKRLSVRQARHQKSKQGQNISRTIRLSEATVTIRFRHGPDTAERVLETLELALDLQRSEASS